MILTIDMGNSNIVIGGIDDSQTYFVERVTTNRGKTDLEYAVNIKSILEIHNVPVSSIEGAILSSVVPPLNNTILSAVEKICGFRPMLVGSGMKTGLNIIMDNPKTVGSDMIVDAVAAIREYPGPIIIIDMGTATTMSVVDKQTFTNLGTRMNLDTGLSCRFLRNAACTVIVLFQVQFMRLAIF